MSCKVEVVIAMVVMVAAVAGAAPHQHTVRTLKLHEALNMTTCPIKEFINEEVGRVPRYVKELKCRRSEPPHKWCRDRGLKGQECCGGAPHRHAADRELQCEEIRDSVMVYFPASHTRVQQQFAVGCVCTVRGVTRPNLA